jgi:hypothetical protein
MRRTLVYKRTHVGDPDESGCFGAFDCMGKIRSFEYDAVIGIGGIGDEARSHGIAGKVCWIGIGPKKTESFRRGPFVTFDQFFDYGNQGPNMRIVAPRLAKRMYSGKVRYLLDAEAGEQADIEKLLELAVNGLLPSVDSPVKTKASRHGCRPCGKRRPTSHR